MIKPTIRISGAPAPPSSSPRLKSDWPAKSAADTQRTMPCANPLQSDQFLKNYGITFDFFITEINHWLQENGLEIDRIEITDALPNMPGMGVISRHLLTEARNEKVLVISRPKLYWGQVFSPDTAPNMLAFNSATIKAILAEIAWHKSTNMADFFAQRYGLKAQAIKGNQAKLLKEAGLSTSNYAVKKTLELLSKMPRFELLFYNLQILTNWLLKKSAAIGMQELVTSLEALGLADKETPELTVGMISLVIEARGECFQLAPRPLTLRRAESELTELNRLARACPLSLRKIFMNKNISHPGNLFPWHL